MQLIVIIGNLTRNPESRATQDGKTVCNFTVAVNRRQKNSQGQNDADFFRVAVWGNLADPCQKYLSKGKKVAVTGSVSVHTYTAQDGTTRAQMEVLARDVEFLSKAGEGGEQTAQEQQAPAGYTPVSSDELPF